MKFTNPCAIFLLLILTIVCGCSNSDSKIDPIVVSPDDPGPISTVDKSPASASHLLLGFNLIYIDTTDPDDVKVEMVPVRTGSMHLNILKLLETGLCTDCFKIAGFDFPEPGVLDVNIQITHPIHDLSLTVFDVRGIMMFNGSHEFPASGLTMSDSWVGEGELLNAEGYTQLYNGSTLGMAGDFFTYYKGNLATDTVPNSLLNGFMRHISSDSGNTRNALLPGDFVIRKYSLSLPTFGQLVLGYAVDASWDVPLVDPVSNPITDFGENANCLEPWKIYVAEFPVDDGLTEDGGYTTLLIDVYDWQGKSSHAAPMVECPELFDGALAAAWKEDHTSYTRYEATVGNTKFASQGNYRCLVSVEDNENATSPAWMDLTAYQVITLEVTDFEGYGWAARCGGPYGDEGRGVATDSFGNVYTTGIFDLSVKVGDTWYGISEATLRKFSTADGNHAWSLYWGSDLWWDDGNGVATDSSGNVYVTGSFKKTVNFDPGDGSDLHSSNGEDDVFLSKFDSSGNFEWARTWGGPDYDLGYGVAADGLGNVYVTGYFQDTADFDPGGGTEDHTSIGTADAFLSKFNSSGNFVWVRTWEGSYNLHDRGFGVAGDSSGNVYVTIHFKGTVDFDPDPVDEDLHTSNGARDVFLSKFDSSGSFIWARTWGGPGYDKSYGVAIDALDNVYITGYFEETVDFDPGGGTDNQTSNGFYDVFLSKFDSSGNFKWARTWGGSSDDKGNGVAADGSGNVYVTGYFRNTVDFDPEGGDPHTSNGHYDIFLSKFDLLGAYKWARTWGGPGYEQGYGVATDDSGNIYVTGCFEDTVDFIPGPNEGWLTSQGEEDEFLIKFLPNGWW